MASTEADLEAGNQQAPADAAVAAQPQQEQRIWSDRPGLGVGIGVSSLGWFGIYTRPPVTPAAKTFWLITSFLIGIYGIMLMFIYLFPEKLRVSGNFHRWVIFLLFVLTNIGLATRGLF